MFLMGTDFFASPGALFCIPNQPERMTEVTISNGIFDRLRGDNEAESAYTTDFSDEWNEDTAFDAKFEEDLNAGNTDYTVATVDKIRIKRRDPDGNWITLFQIDINKLEDFYFHVQDIWAPSGAEVEYAVIPVAGLNEGEFNTVKYCAVFEGLHISDAQRAEGTIYNVTISDKTKNAKTSVVGTLAGRYPFVIENGENNYYTIPVEAFFYDPDKNLYENVRRRKDIAEWLHNGKPKIFRTNDGNMWLARVTSPPVISQQKPQDIELMAWELTEIGNASSQQDLVKNGILPDWGA